MTVEIGFLSVNATGIQVVSSGTSQAVAIPVNAANRLPKHIRLQCTGNVYVRPGNSGVTATVNDILVSPNYDLGLAVTGFTHIGVLQESASAKLNITPLES